MSFGLKVKPKVDALFWKISFSVNKMTLYMILFDMYTLIKQLMTL